MLSDGLNERAYAPNGGILLPILLLAYPAALAAPLRKDAERLHRRRRFFLALERVGCSGLMVLTEEPFECGEQLACADRF
jgi:hypothetical protein